MVFFILYQQDKLNGRALHSPSIPLRFTQDRPFDEFTSSSLRSASLDGVYAEPFDFTQDRLSEVPGRDQCRQDKTSCKDNNPVAQVAV
jgi:hypothetical protein